MYNDHRGAVVRLEQERVAASLGENLKKAMTEPLLLHLLSQRDYYIGELTEALGEKSMGRLSITSAYSAIYRLLQGGFVQELEKRFAPDGRRRQYYCITPQGRQYLEQLLTIYRSISQGIDAVLEEGTQRT